MYSIIQCERDFCRKMKLNAPAFGTTPPICAKTMAGHCNDKTETFQGSRIKQNRKQKKNIGDMASYYKENGEHFCIYEMWPCRDTADIILLTKFNKNLNINKNTKRKPDKYYQLWN